MANKPARHIWLFFGCGDFFGIGCHDLINGGFDCASIGDLLHAAFFNDYSGFSAFVSDNFKQIFCDLAADITGDGNLDIFDVFAFVEAFNLSDPVADFIDDGVIDVFDVFAYVEAFNAGCP